MTEKIYSFNMKQYDFEFLLKDIFNTEIELEQFHKLLPENEKFGEVNFENDNADDDALSRNL